MIADSQIEPSVFVEICHCDSAAVVKLIRPDRTSDIYEIAIANVGKETVVLISVPRILSNKIFTEEKTLLV